jgi:hypothetical protein
MATLLVTLCIKYDRKDLILPATILGFGLDISIGFFIANLIKLGAG